MELRSINISEMQAGRELDALIAEKVMRWTGESMIRDDGFDCNSTIWLKPRDGFDSLEWTGYISRFVPEFRGELRCKNELGGTTILDTNGTEWNPSTDIATAWQVMKKMLDSHGDIAYIFARELCSGEPDISDWDGEDAVFFVLKVLNRFDPLLICKAAIRAVTE